MSTKFQVGQRVAVYSERVRNVGVVSGVGTWITVRLEEGGAITALPQQCRRLKPPRREVEVIGFDSRDDGFYLLVKEPISIYCGLKLREIRGGK